MSRSDIEEIELSIRQAKKFVELGKAVDRLVNNRDFKKVVLEHYFDKEAVRLVHAMGEPALQSEESQQSIQLQMRAISNLRQFLDQLSRQAEMAAKAIEESEDVRDELLAEALESGYDGGDDL